MQNQKVSIYIAVLCSVLGSSLISLSAFGAAFPKTPEGMNSKTAEDMKAWPEVKVKLGQPINESDLKGKTETELALMRNSIPAQAGFQFSEPWLKNYFTSRNWYKPGKFNTKALAPIDYANAQVIKKFQKDHDMLTAFHPTVTREAASTDTPSKLTGDALLKRIVTMRYCDFYIGGDYSYTLTFHRDGTVAATEMGDNGPYGSSYGEAYGDAYGSSYGNAYGGDPNSTKGKWGLTTDKSHVQVTMDGWKKPATLFFGTRSYYAHRCYSDVRGIP